MGNTPDAATPDAADMGKNATKRPSPKFRHKGIFDDEKVAVDMPLAGLSAASLSRVLGVCPATISR